MTIIHKTVTTEKNTAAHNHNNHLRFMGSIIQEISNQNGTRPESFSFAQTARLNIDLIIRKLKKD